MAIDPIFGGLLGAGANLVGGLIGADSSKVANERAADVAANNVALQKEFAQTGVTWKARDAMRAYQETGIHPLQLLGTSGASYSPVSAAFTTSALGESIGKMGQDVSRAIHAGADRADRQRAMDLQEVMANHAMERGGLENELLRVRIQSERMRMMQQGNVSPASPTVASIPDTTRLIMDVARGDVNPREPGAHPEVKYIRTVDGGLQPVMSDTFQKATEDSFFQKLPFYLRHYLYPSLLPGYGYPPGDAPKGKIWYYDPTRFAYYLRDAPASYQMHRDPARLRPPANSWR